MIVTNYGSFCHRATKTKPSFPCLIPATQKIKIIILIEWIKNKIKNHANKQRKLRIKFIFFPPTVIHKRYLYRHTYSTLITQLGAMSLWVARKWNWNYIGDCIMLYFGLYNIYIYFGDQNDWHGRIFQAYHFYSIYFSELLSKCKNSLIYFLRRVTSLSLGNPATKKKKIKKNNIASFSKPKISHRIWNPEHRLMSKGCWQNVQKSYPTFLCYCIYKPTGNFIFMQIFADYIYEKPNAMVTTAKSAHKAKWLCYNKQPPCK